MISPEVFCYSSNSEKYTNIKADVKLLMVDFRYTLVGETATEDRSKFDLKARNSLPLTARAISPKFRQLKE